MLWPQVSIGTQPDTPCSLCRLAGYRFCPVSHTLNVDALTFRCEWFWWVSSQQRRRGKALTGTCLCSVKSGFHNSHSALVRKKVPEPPKGSTSCSSPHGVVGGVLWDCCNSERQIYLPSLFHWHWINSMLLYHSFASKKNIHVLSVFHVQTI